MIFNCRVSNNGRYRSNKTEIESNGKELGKGSWFEHVGIEYNDEEEKEVSGQDSKWSVFMSRMLIGVTKVPKYPLEVVSTSKIKGFAELALALPKGKIVSWKTTSLEMKISLVVKSNTLYLLTPKGYPKKKHFLALGANFDLLCERVEA